MLNQFQLLNHKITIIMSAAVSIKCGQRVNCRQVLKTFRVYYIEKCLGVFRVKSLEGLKLILFYNERLF